MTDTVRASSSDKDDAPPSTSGAGAGAGAGAGDDAGAGAGADVGAGAGTGAGAGAALGAGATLVELLPKKSARGKSAAFFSGFCLLQLKTAGTKVVDISTSTCFAVATAVATVSDDFFSTAISTFLSMFSSVNLRLSFLSSVVSR